MARDRTRTKVHAAALSLALENTASAVTMEGIAARAGVSKQTVYRSWPSTGAVLFDALLARSADENGRVLVPNSGDLSSDLLALATGMIAELTDPSEEALLRAVTADLQSDAALAGQYRDLLLGPQLGAISARLDEAGVPASGDVAELFVGPIFYRWLLRSQPFDSEWVSAHVGRVIRSITP
ncbi:transcriptional regulator, TetR family [Agreia bicolorata]|uniref:Transcriptional regulator, TetR family n=1 Tax=Agreia bicolorata TaxID=110935 RepID=A0A1T4XBG1_9MICO|nr:TetR/AcrR family transcriptional regulator [Agreia bicolorata]SKA86920.1 transcriptional regulator, TetR family [Agreia bicolorata]